MALKTETGIPLYYRVKSDPVAVFSWRTWRVQGIMGENKSNMLQSDLFDLSSLPQLSVPSAFLASIVFTSECETTFSIFLRIKQEPHQLWMASNNYVFGDGLLYVLNDCICIHNTLPWLRQWLQSTKYKLSQNRFMDHKRK